MQEDARRNRALELLRVIRKVGLVDQFTMAIILHITGDKGKVYQEGVLVDIGCELDGPDLVMRLMSISEADIAAAIQTVGAFSQWQRTGVSEVDSEPRERISNEDVQLRRNWEELDDPLEFDHIGPIGPHAEDIQRAIAEAREQTGFDPTRPVLE